MFLTFVAVALLGTPHAFVRGSVKQRTVEEVASSLGAAREAMTKENFEDERRGLGGGSWTYILFPVGVGDRRYYVTCVLPNETSDPAGWLSCQTWRNGRLHEEWTIPLGWDESEAKRRKTNAVADSFGAGTLAKLIATLNRRAKTRGHPEALAALNAVKPFAWYEFDIVGEAFIYGYLPPMGPVVPPTSAWNQGLEYHVLPHTYDDAIHLPPSFGQPYPITISEKQWIQALRSRVNTNVNMSDFSLLLIP